MRRSTPPPEPSRVMEEFAGEVLASVDREAFTSFSYALNDMMDFHAFLLRMHTTNNEQGELGSYAFLPDSRPHLSRHQVWERQYFHIFQRATDLLGREPEFFMEAARVPGRLIRRTAADIPPKILNTLLRLTLTLFHSRGDWWVRRVYDETGKRPNIFEPDSLLGYEAKAYKDTTRRFVGTWENVCLQPKAIWNWEHESLSPAEQWNRLCSAMGFFREYWFCSAYMVAASIWYGDEFSATFMSDSLIRWPQYLMYEPNSHSPRLATSMLNPDFCRHTWKDIQTGLQLRDSESDPKAVFSAIIENLWIDIILTLSALLISWGREQSIQQTLPLKFGKKLLLMKASEEYEDLSHPRTASRSSMRILTALIRQYTSGEGFHDSSYRDWLGKDLIYGIDILTERDVVPGRMFTPTTIGSLYRLEKPQLAILMSSVGLDGSTGTTLELEAAVRSLFHLPNSEERVNLLERFLQRLRMSLGEMKAEAWEGVLVGLTKSDSERNNFDKRKEAIDNLLSSTLDHVQKEKTKREDNA